MKHITRIGQLCWRDTRGDASAIGMLLVVTIIGLGAVVGLATVRDQVVQELGDIAVSLNQLDHSFDFTIEVDANGDGDLNDPQDQIISCSYTDTGVGDLTDDACDAPSCLTFN